MCLIAINIFVGLIKFIKEGKYKKSIHSNKFIYLFGVLRRFQHCTGHITMGSWKGRGNQYIEFARVLYCKLLTNGKQLPSFPHKALTGIEPRPQRWEARVLPLYHRGPSHSNKDFELKQTTLILVFLCFALVVQLTSYHMAFPTSYFHIKHK